MRVGKRNKLLNGGQRQVGIILLDFFKRRTKLGVLHDSIRENAGAAHNGAPRHLAGYSFDSYPSLPRSSLQIVMAVYPPSTRRIDPVTNEAARGEAR